MGRGLILTFFAPHGRHAAPIGVKFGVEESTDDPLLCQISPPLVQWWGPQKTKNILNFYKILGHKRLSLVYYLHNFYVIFRDHGELHEGSRYKIWGDSFKAFHSYSRGF